MAIGRPQMEEQIEGFKNGGGAGRVEDDEFNLFQDYTAGTNLPSLDMQQFASEDTDPFDGGLNVGGIDLSGMTNLLAFQRAQQRANQPFGERLQDYTQRLLSPQSYTDAEGNTVNLPPIAGSTTSRDIFDLASDLGAGILSAQQKGVRNPFVGLGVGFTNYIENNRKELKAAENQYRQVALQAANLAIQDEQRAKKFLDDLSIKFIDSANKEAEYITIEHDEVGEDGKMTRTTSTFPNTAKYKPQIDQLVLEKNGKPTKLAETVINMPDPNAQYADKKAYDTIDAQTKDYLAKAKAAQAVLDQVGEAFILAKRIVDAGGEFGPFADSTLKARELISSLGYGNLLDAEGAIGPQKALRQLSMGFTMAIVSQTKGAISNREMELFINASPTLGSTYEGYMTQLALLEKLAGRDKQFANDYLNEMERLRNEEGKKGEDLRIALDLFTANYGDNNPLLTSEEEALLRREARKSAEKFQDVNPETGQTYEDTFIPAQFKKLFDDEKRRMQRDKASLPIITNQAQYDLLESGDRYIEDGEIYVKN
tara:strand:- start:2282 stop:3898 length:1617 start_codon:yes stop_codon:yes gene_type:complete